MQHRSGPTASNRGVLHVHVHRFCSAQASNEQHDSNQIHSDCVKLNQTKAINITKLCPEELRVFMCTSIKSNIIRCAGGRVEHHLRWGGAHHLRCAAATSVRGGCFFWFDLQQKHGAPLVVGGMFACHPEVASSF